MGLVREMFLSSMEASGQLALPRFVGVAVCGGACENGSVLATEGAP